jgi:hypothetical protein
MVIEARATRVPTKRAKENIIESRGDSVSALLTGLEGRGGGREGEEEGGEE